MFRENQEFELGLRNKPADKSAVEKIQDAIETAIQPGVSFTEFIEKLKIVDVETSVKFNSEGVIQGISYFIDGVAFAGGKLGRNDKACTLKGLAMRGVKFDRYRDGLLTQHETKDDKQQNEAHRAKISGSIHPKNSQIEFD
jgi:hypothetical protein